MNKYAYLIDCQGIASGQEVLGQLCELQAVLSGTDLAHMQPFTQAYIIITEAINDAYSRGQFRHPEIMNRLVVVFANRYFLALNQFAVSGSFPKGWRSVQASWLRKRQLRPLALLLGANSHINYDLVRALRDTVKKPDVFAGDYQKISQLLLACSSRIAREYRSENRLSQLFFRDLWIRPIMRLILSWRAFAWQQHLMQQGYWGSLN